MGVMIKTLGKIIILILTLLPATYIILGVTVIPLIVGGRTPIVHPLLIVDILVFILIPAQPIFYIINLFRNSTVAKEKRGLWIALFSVGNFIA